MDRHCFSKIQVVELIFFYSGKEGLNDWFDIEYWTEDGEKMLAKNQVYSGSPEFADIFQKMELKRKY